MKHTLFRLPLILLIILVAAAMSYVSKARLSIDSDITESLPLGDPVIAEARHVFVNHPMKDRIVIDLSTASNETRSLIAGADMIEKKLQSSGLFKDVGMSEFQSLFPELLSYILCNLPVLFTEDELERRIQPLLKPEKIREALAQNLSKLTGIEGIGQAGMIAADPLGLRNLVLAKLSYLAPTKDVQFVQGHLISSDGSHLLITAEPKGSATDTVLARKIDSLISDCRAELQKAPHAKGSFYTLTPVGAYRAALDNEETAKRDTRMAVILATIGIAVLLLVGFPRPFIGLLALLPAVLGTIAAAFIYSLFTARISIMAIGFGSTIISFTVDYGIAYLLFLDRPYETYGLEATKQVWSLGLLAMLTTAVSFAFLFISDFSVLTQIGFFSALGVVFTYIFVHLLFPVLFPVMPPAKREGFIPLQKFVDLIMSSRPRTKAYGALTLFAVMLPFAKPDFRVDLAAMNTVSEDALKAEDLLTRVWGNVFGKLYLMVEAPGPEDLQRRGDELADKLDRDVASGVLTSAFVPSMLFPGAERARRNLEAWRRFWTTSRITALKKSMVASAEELGFTPNAFDSFIRLLSDEARHQEAIPEKFYGLLGIHEMAGGKSWALFSVLTRGSAYHAQTFSSGIISHDTWLFDPLFFSERLGSILMTGFIKMALIVGAVTLAVALVYLLDIRLTLIAMAPTIFSLVCTFGSLKLLGQPVGIPAIIVTVIVIGMCTDYALYLVRAYQRYLDESHPSVGLIRLTVFLSAISTMIGFGALSLARHTLLNSAGRTLFLGIGYSFLGTMMIVPPLLAKVFKPGENGKDATAEGPDNIMARVKRRYRFMEPIPRIRAHLTLRFDPIIHELPDFISSPKNIMDSGTGYGVHALWLLELFPDARYYGIEPEENRRRFAAWAIGTRGTVASGQAPELPDISDKVDVALSIDRIHHLSDQTLSQLLTGMREKLRPGGVLIIRGAIGASGRFPGVNVLAQLWRKFSGRPQHYRDQTRIVDLMNQAGFSVMVKDSARKNMDEKWFIGRVGSGSKFLASRLGPRTKIA